MELFYKAPAECWIEGLPIGNGRLGAVVYGDPLHETIQLNEETLWSGHYDPHADNPECALMLEEIRRNTFDGCKYGGWGHAVIEFQPRMAVEENRYFHGAVRVTENVFHGGISELVSISGAEEFVFRGNELKLKAPYLDISHVGQCDIQPDIR